MKIIIVGDGKVGHALAKNLAVERHDVVVIDNDADTLSRAVESLDVLCVKGSAISARTLKAAGVENCDLLIAATTKDEVNMLCCLLGKKLGANLTISRIRDPEYAQELSLLKQEIGLDTVINPEQATAREIARLIKFPPALNVEKFSKGRVEMIKLEVSPDMDIAGKALKDLPGNLMDSVLIGAVEKDGKIIIPNGDTILHADDSIHVIGQPSKVYRFTEKLGIQFKKIREVMIVGGGRIAYYLSKQLDELDIKTRIIEIDYKRCVDLTELLPNSLIINGDGTQEDFLLSENLDKMGAFVSLTGRDEDNLITAFLAKQYGVPKVIVKANRFNDLKIIKDMGLDCIVSPKLITADDILSYVRGMENALHNSFNTIYRILDGTVEAAAFTVSNDVAYLNKQIRKLDIPQDMLLAAIIRKDNRTIIPKGKDMILSGDILILVSKNTTYTDLNNIIGVKS